MCFSPGGPATEFFHSKYDVQIDLGLLEFAQHHHREIHLYALPLRPQRLVVISHKVGADGYKAVTHAAPSLASGYLYENGTADMRFTFTGLTPYTRYTMVVRAKAAGEVGPAAEDEITTPPEGMTDT